LQRTIVYPASIPQDVDILNTNRNVMVALGRLAQATMGTGTCADGLLCHQTTPASMQVTVDPGCIFSNQVIDSLGYGSLASNSNQLVKVGTLDAPQNFTLTAPSTSGWSTNYLIEATFVEQDGTPVVLPYYNAANPNQPFSGPSNSGTPQNTVRQQLVSLQLKAGAPAATGTQTTPSVDNGWIGLWVIQVNNGMTSITNSAITAYSPSSFIPWKLPQLSNVVFTNNIRQKAAGNTTFYVSPSGNDTNNSGLTSGSPFATLAKAWNTATTQYDGNGYVATIQLANGTYTVAGGNFLAGESAAGWNGITIAGNANASLVTIAATTGNALSFFGGPPIALTGMTLTATGSGLTGFGLIAGYGAYVSINNLVFGTCGAAQINASNGGLVTTNQTGAYSITGGAPSHISAGQGGAVWISGTTITLTGTPAFSTGFVSTDRGLVIAGGANFVGAATGPKFLNNDLSTISTNGAGVSFLPGSVAGTTSNGSVYV
jgi:hypothetical protein